MKVVVIGAGVAGLSIGWRLAQAGADVVVLERGQPGSGATWASAGMLAALLEHEAEAGPDAMLAQRAAAHWPRFAVDVEELSGLPIHYRRDGLLLVASNTAEADALRKRAAANAALQFADSAHAQLHEPLLPPGNFGALRDPSAAQVDNRALAAALVAAFRSCDGQLLTTETAVAIETDKGRATGVRTSFARHPADAVVLAAGAWSGEFDGVPKSALPPVRPVKGQMIALSPPVGTRLPAHLIWGQQVYLVPRHDRLLVGATVEEAGFDTALTREGRDWLLERAIRLLPALSGWRVADHWAGLRPGSADGLPILGETALPRLFAATGQNRNGILFAPVMADVLCDLVLGRSPAVSGPLVSGSLDIGAFDPRRFAR